MYYVKKITLVNVRHDVNASKTPIKTTTVFKRDMFQCLLPPFSNVNDNSADRLHTKVGSILEYTRVHSK